ALLAAARDEDLLLLVVEAVLARELGDDRLLQRWRSARRGVLGEPLVDGRDGRVLDELRRVEVRLSGPQPDDVVALRFPALRLGGHQKCGGGLDGLEAVCDKRHECSGSGWK